MSGRSGLDAQIGVALEESYGTFKAPTRFFPFGGETLEWKPNYGKGAGIRAGRRVQAQNLHRRTNVTVEGGVSGIEFLDQGMGILFNMLHGETVAFEGLSESAFKQVHEIGLSSPFGKSLTIQPGRPDTGDADVNAFSYVGCKIPSLKVTLEANGFATVEFDVDGRDEETDPELAEATYDAGALPYNWEDMAVKLDGETAGNVRSISITIPVPMKTDRYHLGNGGLKDEPIANAKMGITGEATVEFATMADHDRFKKEKVVTLELFGTGAEIDAEHDMSASIELTAGKQVSSAPTVDGEDVLTTDVSFEALDNEEKAPVIVELVSTDTAL